MLPIQMGDSVLRWRAGEGVRRPSRINPVNRLPFCQALLRLGLPLGPLIMLTVTGRKTGEPRATPVGLFELDGRRYLFSTFGEVNWVHNLRAAGRALLSHGRTREPVAADELLPEAAAPILKAVLAPYLASLVTRPMLQAWYGVTPHSSPSDFITAARATRSSSCMNPDPLPDTASERASSVPAAYC